MSKYDPGPDDFLKQDLAEHDPMWAAVADALYEWQGMHVNGLHMTLYGSEHGTGQFLEHLAANGYRVTAIEAEPFEQLMPKATD